MRRFGMFFLGSTVLWSLFLSCGNPVERNIERLARRGGDRDQAIMELGLARKHAIPRLIAALNDPERPAEVRGEVGEILFMMYIRGSDARIVPALLEHVDNESPVIRARIASALANIGKVDALHPLLEQLEKEEDSEVLREILTAIQIIDRWEQRSLPGGGVFWVIGGKNMTEEEKMRFIERLKVLRDQALEPELRDVVVEFLEEIAQQLVREGDKAVLKADLSGAEVKYLEAKALVSESKNVNHRLGKFYFDNVSREKGLRILQEHGMVTYAPRLKNLPVIDGDLSDRAWGDAVKIMGFYQNIRLMRTVPAEGNSEVYLGYTDRDLYIAVKGYEESTKDLAARFNVRDGKVWQDDCAEVFFDPDHDYNTFYQIVVNCIGTIADYSYNVGRGYWGRQPSEWNSTVEVGTKIEEKFWTLEMKIPLKDLGVSRVKRGDIWGFNVARVRVAHRREYDQWVPTYGNSLRPDRFGFLVFE